MCGDGGEPRHQPGPGDQRSHWLRHTKEPESPIHQLPWLAFNRLAIGRGVGAGRHFSQFGGMINLTIEGVIQIDAVA